MGCIYPKKYIYKIIKFKKMKGKPKRDGSGKGKRLNKNRGGCKNPRKTGK